MGKLKMAKKQIRLVASGRMKLEHTLCEMDFRGEKIVDILRNSYYYTVEIEYVFLWPLETMDAPSAEQDNGVQIPTRPVL